MKLNNKKVKKVAKDSNSKLKIKKTSPIVKEMKSKESGKPHQELEISLKTSLKKRQKSVKVSKKLRSKIVSNTSDVEIKEDEGADQDPSEQDDSTEESGNEEVDTAGGPKDKGKKNKNPYAVFVGNLPYTATPEEVRKHFEKAGKVKEVRLPRDKTTNRRRGFGYVQLKNRSSYEKALTLHHTRLHGRQINVEYTTQGKKGGPKEEKIKQKNLKLRALAKKGILASVSMKKKVKKGKSKSEVDSENPTEVKVKEKKKKTKTRSLK